jgi:hypothetical protein
MVLLPAPAGPSMAMISLRGEFSRLDLSWIEGSFIGRFWMDGAMRITGECYLTSHSVAAWTCANKWV